MAYTLSLRSDGSEKVPYTHPEYPLYLSHALLSRACEGRVPFHWHDDLEILTVLSGRMNYAVDGEVFPSPPAAAFSAARGTFTPITPRRGRIANTSAWCFPWR